MTSIQALLWNHRKPASDAKGKVQGEHVLKAITKAHAGGG